MKRNSKITGTHPTLSLYDYLEVCPVTGVPYSPTMRKTGMDLFSRYPKFQMYDTLPGMIRYKWQTEWKPSLSPTTVKRRITTASKVWVVKIRRTVKKVPVPDFLNPPTPITPLTPLTPLTPQRTWYVPAKLRPANVPRSVM